MKEASATPRRPESTSHRGGTGCLNAAVRPRSFLPFTTERLTVRAMRPSDVTTFTTYRNLPEVARYQDWELPYTRDLAHQLIDEMDGLNGPRPGEWVQLAIDDIDGTFVGDLAVYLDTDVRTAMIGYSLHPALPGARLRDRGRRCTGRPALRSAARAPRRGDARSGEPRVGPRPRTARLPVRGTGAQGGVRPRRVGRRRPLRDPRRRAPGVARAAEGNAVDSAARRDHSRQRRTRSDDWPPTTRSNGSSPRCRSRTPTRLVPEIIDGHPGRAVDARRSRPTVSWSGSSCSPPGPRCIWRPTCGGS